jgi:hypothetical protein
MSQNGLDMVRHYTCALQDFFSPIQKFIPYVEPETSSQPVSSSDVC